jgi:hypothetical protein
MTQLFGRYPSGSGPASVSLPIPLAQQVPVVPARGRLYVAQDWRLNVVGGDYQATADEIDAGMSIAMSVIQGSYKPDKTIGNTLNQIKYLGTPQQHSDVVNRVNNSNPTARLLASGDVAIASVREEVTRFGMTVHVDYWKPKLGGPRKTASYVPGGAPQDGKHNGMTQSDGTTVTTSNGEGIWL